MSSILEALERAEQERNARGSVPPREPLSRPKSLWRQPRVLFVGVGLLLINLLVWWIMLFNEETPQVAMAPQTQAIPAPRPAAQLAPAPKLQESPRVTEARVMPRISPPPPPPVAQAELPDKPVPSAIPAKAAKPTVPPLLDAVIIPVAKPVIPLPAVASTQPTVRLPAATLPVTTVVASSEEARPVVESPEPVAPPVSPPAAEQMPAAEVSKSSDPEQRAVPEVPTPEPVAAPTVPEVADAAVVEKVERIPEIWELPAAAQQKLKDLKINIHVYNDIPAERFVIIDMRRYREGDELRRPGLKLESITREGVIINYGGGKVKM